MPFNTAQNLFTSASFSPILIPKNVLKATRYGFNSQEKDNEISGGDGNDYTATFWEYDPRLGRRWNIDPKPDPWQSPYVVFADNPIRYTDFNGDTEDERKAAVKTANSYVEKNSGDSYCMGAKGQPGDYVDCSGLISKSVKSAGVEDPNHGGSNKDNGIKKIVGNTTKVPSLNDLKEGNIVVIDWSGKQSATTHGGIITSVTKDKDGNVTSFDVAHSSGTAGSGKSGPVKNTFVVGGPNYSGKNDNKGNQIYGDGLIQGFYTWDNPDKPVIKNSHSTDVQNTTFVASPYSPLIPNPPPPPIVNTTKK